MNRFRVDGLPRVGSGPRVLLTVTGKEPLVCTRVATQLTLRVLGDGDEVLLEKSGSLNGLVTRVWMQRKNDSPTAHEWMPSRFDYEDETIERRAVPIEPGVDSLPQQVCQYWTLETAEGPHSLELAIETSDDVEGTIGIALQEGWK